MTSRAFKKRIWTPAGSLRALFFGLSGCFADNLRNPSNEKSSFFGGIAIGDGDRRPEKEPKGPVKDFLERDLRQGFDAADAT